jgi:hypothetical protein
MRIISLAVAIELLTQRARIKKKYVICFSEARLYPYETDFKTSSTTANLFETSLYFFN